MNLENISCPLKWENLMNETMRESVRIQLKPQYIPNISKINKFQNEITREIFW